MARCPFRLPAALAIGLLLAGAGGAVAAEGYTREQALAGLANQGDVEARREGAAWLGQSGQVEDAPLLLEALRDADPGVRAIAEQSLWQVWSRSGDPEVDRLFQAGVEQVGRGDYGPAIETFSQIIQMRPEFAEGWNKRATLYYLVGDYEKSLADCGEVVTRNPAHFGALSGYGLIYLQLRQPAEALRYFERALTLNPNLAQIETAVEELRRLLQPRPRDTA